MNYRTALLAALLTSVVSTSWAAMSVITTPHIQSAPLDSLAIIDNGVQVNASVDLEGGRVIISDFKTGDLLAVDEVVAENNNIITQYDALKGVLTLIPDSGASVTAEQLQNVFQSVTLKATALGSRMISFSIGIDTVYFHENGHFYQYIDADEITWSDAKDNAEASTLYGMQGYLVTITSQSENDFVSEKISGDTWMGASDGCLHGQFDTCDSQEGQWRWVSGPESGTLFWQGDENGLPVEGQYNNWDSVEPNNWSDAGQEVIYGEDHGHLYANGTWNDYLRFNDDIKGYVIEYGDMGNDDATVHLAATKHVIVHENNDSDGDLIPDVLEGVGDSDNDGTPDYLDNDSDNDGIPDILESGLVAIDTDNDGIVDQIDVDQTGGTDANSDGIDDNAQLADSDNDGTIDAHDVDSDNDGLPDALESGFTFNDSDNDGINDDLDVDVTGGNDVNLDGIDDDVAALNNDPDNLANYQDADSDSDGIADSVENGLSQNNNDQDEDGIIDLFDVDQTGGVDHNQNGIDDALEQYNNQTQDFDNDGIVDYLDLDSDNDSIFDVEEAAGASLAPGADGHVGNGDNDLDANGLNDSGDITTNPTDSDGDGTPDYLDVDSNNDGTFDIVDRANHPFDNNDDGMIDHSSDVDGDGIDDVMDEEPGMFGSDYDLDFDLVPSVRDIDDDNDGVSDAVESLCDLDGDGINETVDINCDSDGDGVPNRIDPDSDNDGVPDVLEASQAMGQGADADLDGIDDMHDVDIVGGPDANNDGIRDTSQNLKNNGVDQDSDGDGISDNLETLNRAPLGMDSDVDGIDDAFDVDKTGGIDSNNDGFDDAVFIVIDIDGDGIPNFLDTDSDNDGVLDSDEAMDYNRDGIADYQQVEPSVKTAVGGSVISSMSWLLMLLPLILIRKKNIGKTFLIVTVFVSSNTAAQNMAYCQPEKSIAKWMSDEFKQCVYVGGSLGLSVLNPDDSNSGWKVQNTSSPSVELMVGWKFLPKWFAEANYFYLGQSKLEHLNPAITGSETITYQTPAVFAGHYFLPTDGRANVYAKVGVGKIFTKPSADRLNHREVSQMQLGFGLGGEYQINEQWFARAGWQSFDRDAHVATLSIARTIGKARVTESSENELSQTEVDLTQGFAVGVYFDFDSSELDLRARRVLSEIADLLRKRVNINLAVYGHTSEKGDSDYNQKLSDKRAQVATDYLISLGVSVKRLQAKGLGESKPLNSSGSEDDHAKNRRVDFEIIQIDY